MKKDFFKDSKIKYPAYEPWISDADKKIVSKAMEQNMLQNVTLFITQKISILKRYKNLE